MNKRYIGLKPFNNKVFYQNAIFDENSETGSFYLVAARRLLEKNNIIMNTIDIPSPIPTFKDVYFEVPYPWEIKLWLQIVKNRKKNILFIGEPPLVNPFSFMRIIHPFFSKIYTWDDDLVENIKYFKYFLPKSNKGIDTKKVPFKDKALLVLMNGNQAPFLPFQLLSSTKELYTQRSKAIDFFDTNYPSDFSLAGRGWNKPARYDLKQKIFGYKKYKTYKGAFPSKNKYKILSKFKFCLCFENSSVTGYISEKIIDCFKARCVPVYLGAPNISNFIDPKCFIDFRKFKSYRQLAQFIKGIDENTYNGYINEIERFLSSNQFKYKWSIEAFTKTILKEVVN